MKENQSQERHFFPNEKHVSLTEYFANLPRAVRKPVIVSAPKEELITEIARMCGKTRMTARRWVYGYVEPCLAEKEKIAALLHCTVEDLFPKSKENEEI